MLVRKSVRFCQTTRCYILAIVTAARASSATSPHVARQNVTKASQDAVTATEKISAQKAVLWQRVTNASRF
jgi:hypothetical protein